MAGGWDVATFLASAEIYNPTANTWSSAGNLSAAAMPVMITLPNGQILAIAGPTAELYKPTANAWSNYGNLSTPRWFPTLTLLSGQVLIVGGINAAGSALPSAELGP